MTYGFLIWSFTILLLIAIGSYISTNSIILTVILVYLAFFCLSLRYVSNLVVLRINDLYKIMHKQNIKNTRK